MAGFCIVILPFIFAGMLTVAAVLIALGVFFTACGTTLTVVGFTERKRQAKFGVKNPVHIFMIVYGFLMLSAVAASVFYIIKYGSEAFTALFMAGIYSLIGIPAVVILAGIFLLVGGISLVVIACKEQKRKFKQGVKNPVHIIIMLYGIIMAAIPIGTVLFWSSAIGLLQLLGEFSKIEAVCLL